MVSSVRVDAAAGAMRFAQRLRDERVAVARMHTVESARCRQGGEGGATP